MGSPKISYFINSLEFLELTSYNTVFHVSWIFFSTMILQNYYITVHMKSYVLLCAPNNHIVWGKKPPQYKYTLHRSEHCRQVWKLILPIWVGKSCPGLGGSTSVEYELLIEIPSVINLPRWLGKSDNLGKEDLKNRLKLISIF